MNKFSILLRSTNVLEQIWILQRKAFLTSKRTQLLQQRKLNNSTVPTVFRGTTVPLPLFRCDTLKDQHVRKMSSTQFTVDHDTKNNYFYIDLQESAMAKLDYDWVSPTLVDMHHTEVPPQFQGKGIAKHLAKAAFDHFSAQKVTMRPSCTYLQKYLRDNPLPEYTQLVEKEFMSQI